MLVSKKDTACVIPASCTNTLVSTGKPIVPQTECRNEIFPTTDEVGDCPSEEEGGDGEEEEEPAEQVKGN